MKARDFTGRTHGRAGTYTYGCRCNECRDAWAAYQRGRSRAGLEGAHCTLVMQWMRANRLDIYDQLRDEARKNLGIERVR